MASSFLGRLRPVDFWTRRAQLEKRALTRRFAFEAAEVEMAVEAIHEFLDTTAESGEPMGEAVSDDALLIAATNLVVARRLRELLTLVRDEA